MRILNPKKSSGSSGVSVNESGDLSFKHVTNKETKKLRYDKAGVKKQSFENLKEFLKDDLIEHDGVTSKAKKRQRTNADSNHTDSYTESNQQSLITETSEEEASKKEYLRVYNKGIYLLSMREHSVKEIINKLSLKTERLDLVSAAVDELIERKYLSNERFTESYVRSRQNRGFGPTKIRSELSGKGIKNDMIDRHLDATSSVWYDNALNQYQKKYRSEPITDYNTWTKRARFMQSRGFTMEHIHSTVPQVNND